MKCEIVMTSFRVHIKFGLTFTFLLNHWRWRWYDEAWMSHLMSVRGSEKRVSETEEKLLKKEFDENWGEIWLKCNPLRIYTWKFHKTFFDIRWGANVKTKKKADEILQISMRESNKKTEATKSLHTRGLKNFFASFFALILWINLTIISFRIYADQDRRGRENGMKIPTIPWEITM